MAFDVRPFSEMAAKTLFGESTRVFLEWILNTKFWIDNKTFGSDEIAARFHHRLVQIHVFPNGNGRHARLMTDLLLIKSGEPKFTWGTSGAYTPLDGEGKTRTEYINALQKADQGELSDLIKFVRS